MHWRLRTVRCSGWLSPAASTLGAVALAVRTFGADRVVAILGVSPSLAASERRRGPPGCRGDRRRGRRGRHARGRAARYRANGPDRCFHCKDELFTRIDDDVAASARAERDRLRRERRRRAAARPAGRPGRHRAPGAPPAGRRRTGQGRGPARRPRAGPAVRRQAGRALPGLPDPALRGGHARRSCAQIDEAEAALRALGFARSPGPPSRRHRADRAARPTTCRGPPPTPAPRGRRAPSGPRGSATSRSTSPASSPGRSRCRWSGRA